MSRSFGGTEDEPDAEAAPEGEGRLRDDRRGARPGELELFSSAVDETPYATIRVDGHTETYPARGGGFSKCLRRAFWELDREPLYGEALSAALAHAEMRALLGDVASSTRVSLT